MTNNHDDHTSENSYDSKENQDWLSNYRKKRHVERQLWEQKQAAHNADMRHERALIKRKQFRLVANNAITLAYEPRPAICCRSIL